MVKYGNIALRIIVTILTLGIYGFFWMASITNDVNELSGENEGTVSGARVVLLNILTCGIYSYYWSYKMGERIDKAKMDRGISTSNKAAILYLGLSIAEIFFVKILSFFYSQDFGNFNIIKYMPIGGVITIVVYSLMQNEINKFVESQD